MTATVLGRPEAAAAGKLFVLAAGPTDVVDPLMPILDALGQRTFRVSDAAAVAALPDSHTEGQINLDMGYWAEHRDEIAKRWYDWQAK